MQKTRVTLQITFLLLWLVINTLAYMFAWQTAALLNPLNACLILIVYACMLPTTAPQEGEWQEGACQCQAEDLRAFFNELHQRLDQVDQDLATLTALTRIRRRGRGGSGSHLSLVATTPQDEDETPGETGEHETGLPH